MGYGSMGKIMGYGCSLLVFKIEHGCYGSN